MRTYIKQIEQPEPSNLVQSYRAVPFTCIPKRTKCMTVTRSHVEPDTQKTTIIRKTVGQEAGFKNPVKVRNARVGTRNVVQLHQAIPCAPYAFDLNRLSQNHY